MPIDFAINASSLGLLLFLLDDVELDAPVLLATRLGLVLRDRDVGAVALRRQALGRDAALGRAPSSPTPRGPGSASCIELARAAVVRVALDLDLERSPGGP